MIKVVLIDDERPAIKELEYLLKDYESISISEKYTNPLKAIEEVDKVNPQVVFLDINMPQLKGLDAASMILDRCPSAEIVFVTAYDQYAIEAFEIHALDYILKPVSKTRLAKTIQRIINKGSNGMPLDKEKKFVIRTLGKFQAGWENDNPVKWRTEKTRELFAFLLHFADREVSKEEIIEAVFFDIDAERAIHQIHNGIYYIRKTLQEYGVDKNKVAIEGNYRLKLGDIRIDSFEFKENLKIISPRDIDSAVFESTIGLYDGDYFESEDWAWAEQERERLSRQYMEVLVRLVENYIMEGRFNEGEELLLKAFERDPFIEEISKRLIELYRDTNKWDMAVKHYKKYEKVMKEELGVFPGQAVQKLMKS